MDATSIAGAIGESPRRSKGRWEMRGLSSTLAPEPGSYEPADREVTAVEPSTDLQTGAWEKRYGHLRERDELDVGLRLVTSEFN